ncbi:MAG: DUF3048 domain-containing protein [Candidatus Nanogingivalis sp.]
MKLKKQRFAKIKNWVKTHKKTSITLFIILVLLIGTSVWLAFFRQKPIETTAEPVKVEKPKEVKKYYASLSGLEVAAEGQQNKPVTGVMIENSPNARPQSGLKDAEIVYEAVAEAGITRFLALYQINAPELIGPVRSVREYYVDWAGSYDASLAHVGGSSGALARMRDGNHKDIDQFFNAGSFWRSTDRYAPHNVYTSLQNLYEVNTSKGWSSSNFTGLKRKDTTSSESDQTAQNITMNFSSSQYNTNYAYNSDCNCYFRSQAGEDHLDREKGQITPNVVIAMKVDMWLDSDNYHNQVQTIGNGEAIIFQDSKAITATWQKDSESSPLIFKDNQGQEIKLNRGQTWIGAIPNNSGAVSWQ